jgi:hypothetical protein
LAKYILKDLSESMLVYELNFIGTKIYTRSLFYGFTATDIRGPRTTESPFAVHVGTLVHGIGISGVIARHALLLRPRMRQSKAGGRAGEVHAPASPPPDVLVEGRRAPEHPAHVGDLVRFPAPDVLVEGRRTAEHPAHVGDIGRVPSTNVVVEGLFIMKQVGHVRDLTRVPVAYVPRSRFVLLKLAPLIYPHLQHPVVWDYYTCNRKPCGAHARCREGEGSTHRVIASFFAFLISGGK